MTSPKPFAVKFPQKALDTILAQVRAYRFGDAPADAAEAEWAYGTNTEYLKALCAYWTSDYDWRKCEARLAQFAHAKARLDDMDIHYMEARSENPAAPYLLMTHGWPGSVLEFVEVADALANPHKHGGDEADGVHVICPSLPGYGFSDKPATPLGPLAIAALWDRLMRESIGAPTYVAQGGDWGAMVSAGLGLKHTPAQGGGCRAVHFNMFGLRGGDATPQTEAETEWTNTAAMRFEMEGAYLRLQATKPQTLSFAMRDNPVGVAAWILEKFHGWSDLRGRAGEERAIENVYSKDFLLDNIMLYLLTDTLGSSLWLYRGFFNEGLPSIPAGTRVEVPCGIANFPDPFMNFPPRTMVERSYNVIHWQDYDRFGHFAALEAGEIFVKEVQTFLRAVRDL